MKTVRAMVWQKGLRGFTLVELMVAMVISLFVLMGLFMAFSTNQDSFKLNTKLLRLQDSGRFAIDSIIRDLRMAGDIGCIRSAADQEEAPDVLKEKVQGTLWPGVDKDHMVQGLDWNPGGTLSDGTLHIYAILVDTGKPTDALLWSDCNNSEVQMTGGNPTEVTAPVYKTKTGYRSYTFKGGILSVSDSSGTSESTLLENVVKHAICLGVDAKPTGEMQGTVGKWIKLTNGEMPTSDEWERIIAVQIQMVVASETGGGGTSDEALSNAAVPTFDDFCDGSSAYTPSTTEGHKRLYKRFNATATLRNKVMNGYGPNGWLEAN